MSNTKEVAKKPWYVSSTGEGLSLTIKGSLVALIPLIIIVAKMAGVDIGQDELNEIVNNLDQIVVGITGVISTVMIVYGTVRKIVNRRNSK